MDQRLSSGTKVRLISTGEVGIVIHTWFEVTIDGQDCYVAFFGNEFPEGRPPEIPYVLRYAVESLEVVGT